MLTNEEKQIIEEFAAYRGSDAHFHRLKFDAVNVYRKYCTPQTFEASRGPHMEFMSEIDSKCPDYSYRAAMRKRLIGLSSSPSDGSKR